MFLIFWKRVCLGMRKFVQWRKKCIVHSISLAHSHKGFRVPWKQRLNLCSWRGRRPRRNLVKSLIPRGRSSHRRCSIEIGVLRNFTKFTGKHLCQSLSFNKVADLRPATLLKKRLWHRCFPVNFVKFLRTPFLQNTSGRLLLKGVMNIENTIGTRPYEI